MVGGRLLRPISIHAPRVGSDGIFFICNFALFQFLSTLPAWGATMAVRPAVDKSLLDFYPRSPRGERLRDGLPILNALVFLSTLPAWGATKCKRQLPHNKYISIHAPRVGSDMQGRL